MMRSLYGSLSLPPAPPSPPLSFSFHRYDLRIFPPTYSLLWWFRLLCFPQEPIEVREAVEFVKSAFQTHVDEHNEKQKVYLWHQNAIKRISFWVLLVLSCLRNLQRFVPFPRALRGSFNVISWNFNCWAKETNTEGDGCSIKRLSSQHHLQDRNCLRWCQDSP